MAGGTSIWISSEAKTDPKAIFNLRLLYLLVAVAWGGSFYGFDTGNIGGILTLPSFKNAFGLNDVPQEEQDNRKVCYFFVFLEYVGFANIDEGNNCLDARSRWCCWRIASSTDI